MSKLWEKLVRPLMFRLDAERAHELGLKALQLGLGNFVSGEAACEFEEIERFGLNFANPLGVAAGFDKNGVVVNQLVSFGFGFVEVGTVTYEPQPGNPKPRLFRLPEDNALINRLGFNNEGAVTIATRLKKLDRRCVVGVNIGRNKGIRNEEATENYVECFEIIHPVADYVAVNISSPNTPGLRELQRSESLEDLVSKLTKKNADLGAKPLILKIAPDLTEADIESIVDVALRYRLSGVIATNTTTAHDGLTSKGLGRIGDGGLSGMPLAKRSNEIISMVYRYSKGGLPIIGVGGIFTADDAFQKIAAGASLLQAYTGFVYGGPSFAREVITGLAVILKERGFQSLDEAVGSAVNSR
jgi:dihydroorotate dehydrogenase